MHFKYTWKILLFLGLSHCEKENPPGSKALITSSSNRETGAVPSLQVQGASIKPVVLAPPLPRSNTTSTSINLANGDNSSGTENVSPDSPSQSLEIGTQTTENLYIATDAYTDLLTSAPLIVWSVGQLTFSNAAFTSLCLSWTQTVKSGTPNSAMQYRVYGTTNETNTLAVWPLADSLAVSNWSDSTSYTLSGLTENTAYSINIAVRDSNDPLQVMLYQPISATTLDSTGPILGGSGTISLVPGNPNPTEQTITWQPATADDTPGNQMQYQVYVNGTPFYRPSSSFASQVTLTGLQASSTYNVNVVVTANSKKQATYTTLTFTTGSALSLPSGNEQQVEIAWGNLPATTVQLSWSPAIDNVDANTPLAYLIEAANGPITSTTLTGAAVTTLANSDIMTSTITGSETLSVWVALPTGTTQLYLAAQDPNGNQVLYPPAPSLPAFSSSTITNTISSTLTQTLTQYTINQYASVGDPTESGTQTITATSTQISVNPQLTIPISSGTITTANLTSYFYPGDEVLIIQSQKPTGPLSSELATIQSISANGKTITLQAPLLNSYTAGVVGGSAANITQLVRVVHFSNLTLDALQQIVAFPWNGTVGGIVAVRDVGTTTTLNGVIHVSGMGFSGGMGAIQYSPVTAGAGESYNGASIAPLTTQSTNAAANGSGGAGGNIPNIGGYWSACSGSGGGNGGNGTSAYTSNTSPRLCNYGAAGPIFTTGLASLSMGSGGGGAVYVPSSYGPHEQIATGGHGGGIIVLLSSSIAIGTGGSIVASGNPGLVGYQPSAYAADSGGGGGGAGGTIYLGTSHITTQNSNNQITVSGGLGAGNVWSPAISLQTSYGGNGGNGKLFLTSSATPPLITQTGVTFPECAGTEASAKCTFTGSIELPLPPASLP